MTAERQPLDITALPELSRLADEVRETLQPRIWRRGDEDVAMLVPLSRAVITPVPYSPVLAALLARLPADSVVARTAGILHTDQPYAGIDEETAGAELGVALEYLARMED